MGMEFENCEVGFGKKNELGNGIGNPFQDLLQSFAYRCL